MILVHALIVSLVLTLVLEMVFALVWGVRKKGLLIVALMNLLTNPAVVTLHFLCVNWLGWTVLPVVVLELAAMVVEGFCCRGVVKRPWLFAVLVNLFSFMIGGLL